ncbi:PAS domain S-box protein [Halorientalis brevis]|uniref:histidine kinase n=1 Tax=Halorientalis brevis TaxID=1126241 RepID=A0ABD6CHF8_9EURY
MPQAATVLVVASSRLRELADEIDGTAAAEADVVATKRAAQERLAADSTIDCVVAAQELPDGAGLDLLAQVRETDPSLPFVLLATDGSERLASDAFAADADDYVPVDPAAPAVEEIVTRIDGILEADRETRRSRQQLETIVETVPEGVFVFDEDARIVGGNETGAEMIGYDCKADVIGTSIPDLVADGVFHEEVVEAYLDELPELLSPETDKETTTFEFRAFPGTDDERVFEVRTTLRPADGEYRGAIGVIRDVTERERRREELEQYETIINAIPDPVYATDADGLFEFVNDAMEDLVGYEFPDPQDKGVYLGMTERDLEKSRELIRELLSPDTPREKGMVEMDVITRDGHSIPVENHMALLPYDEGYRGTAGVLRDISEQKRRKRRLDVLDTVLRHNLRNDMNVIIGYAELLADRLDDRELLSAVERIRRKARDLIRIGDEIRTLQNTIEREESDRERSTIDAAPIIDRVVERYQADAPQATLRAEHPEELRVTGDSTLQRALADLIENALEHSDRPDPTVTVSVETDCAPPRSAASDDAEAADWVAIRVADDGPGIPDYERRLINGDEDITPLKHGSGLGLWVVSWITESFGGDVTIESNQPRGSIVTLRLVHGDPPE